MRMTFEFWSALTFSDSPFYTTVCAENIFKIRLFDIAHQTSLKIEHSSYQKLLEARHRGTHL